MKLQMEFIYQAIVCNLIDLKKSCSKFIHNYFDINLLSWLFKLFQVWVPLLYYYSKGNHAITCFSIKCKSKGSLLTRHLILNLSLYGMMTEAGKIILFSVRVGLTSFQSISKMSQIQFLFNVIQSGVSLPINLNKCILQATLHIITGI